LIRAILTDIEGTTSSIRFVREILFPYATRALPRFLRDHAGEPQVREQIRAAAATAGLDDDDLEAVIARLLEWIEQDRKITPLKTLQGMVWKAGYENGDYRAHIYEDACRKLREWAAQDIALYVYSSGSVQAQQLFFRHSTCGNLLPLFRGHFDTATGGKQEAASYRAIAETIVIPAADILFLSDVVEELDAARAAGMHTCLLRRPGETAVSETYAATEHPAAHSFDEIIIPA